MMNKLGASLAIMIAAAAGAAHAADLPTTKAPAVAPPVNCYASFWNWLNSSAADCPISYAGVTLYATLDGGLGYESNGAGYNKWWNNGVRTSSPSRAPMARSGCGRRTASASRSSASR